MESIRILQDTYEKLYAITPPLGDLIEDALRARSPQFWRDDYVTPILHRRTAFRARQADLRGTQKKRVVII